ncbi:hypothetical protein E1J38_014640 [Seonamhaeicola sediminis]|uniref:Type I restriction modification DNA specificity domain-containing protein n=1 Tax=Seonamhaeicola sediminis TaxID=2528206 RepID=A0A562Y8D3_9FLAO|nr:restriction endonuclease subunit S [Seonamhaeicola sediminis]TWO30674.1 hypothetical protein E1J38_014640 [Seonamhaeicola sediminis]
MSEWTEIELGEVAEVQTGPFGSQLKNEQYITGGTPVVTVEHIQDFRIIDFDYPSITDEDKDRLSKYLMKEGDILFTRVGSVDLSAYVSKGQDGWMFSSRMLRVRPNKEINSRFLSYFFQQKSFRDYIINIAVGATMPSINTGILKTIPISYPPLEEQRSIATILSSLDDKIDLLHRQNQTLEQMAETLFRQWFVEEENESWRELKLENVLNVVSGFNHKQEELDEPGQGNILLSMGSIQKSFGLNTDSIRSIVSERVRENQYCYPNDIIITTRDVTQAAEHLGSPVLIPTFFSDKKIVLGSNLYKLEINESLVPASLIYFLLKSALYRQYVKDVASGTSILMLKKADLLEFSFSIPEKLNQNKIQILDDIIEKLNSNYSQIRRLAKIRDSLLPELMSGEVRITY